MTNLPKFEHFSDKISFTKEEILTVLKLKVVKIKFIKADNTVTEMECTLNDALIPVKENPSSIKENEFVIRCYSIDRQGWRSFRIDRLLEIKSY